jgi:hypothetical protein
MSIDPRGQDPDTQPLPTVKAADERQRAAIALGVLALGAIVLVAIMIVFLGSSGSNGPAPQAAGKPAGPAVTVTGSSHASSSASSSSRPKPSHSSPRPSSSPHRPPKHTGPVSCPTRNPCTLPDDVGDVLGAVNAFRAAHGKRPVSGVVTRAARRCAITGGNRCPNGFFWEPVGRSGKQVVRKIAASGDGASFLLDGRLRKIQIGWAYIPASRGFECALVTGH